ncbi:MAG TPA: GAF domain-containing protein [Cyanobacteria bacterium UBA11149]|nr:GAF domain-containing protein [Cyanobacteria bacterium UBA11367]HBE60744.1 GAF domain-containing protein [Cyanobacteria bacterium UBA11366]HBK66016.1 GAF domain-containing protein [Cyanobacteria bacterium UBA11166]HBR75547.1 GAF domain-containing protein [Cyanobacteria bacterium UBA11159]HBS72349.1 GAF domain-containing protein [Cyanobacteria bacterium UBA11153]HBW91187.1 GAF domain-containing protein [Cyanobacteria bacterium UBA11149]HCA98101.1 GAF domain-containing protein [Cyanobacteria
MGEPNQQLRNENKLVTLGRVVETLREEENSDVLIETTLNYLHSEFDYNLIWIGLYDRLEHRLFGKGGFTPTGDTTLLKQKFTLFPGDILEQVVIQQRPVAIPNLQQEMRSGEWRKAAELFGIQGTILYPLRCKDRCFGVALLGWQEWGISQTPGEKAQFSLLLGGLAAALYQIEVNWQHSSTKRPDRSLFQVLDELLEVPTIPLRLDKLVSMTQGFISPSRTNVYWYSPERRYFWHRVGSRQTLHKLADLRSTTAGLMVAEASDFYQAMVDGNPVIIGAGKSMLKAENTERLLKRLRSRSLLAAPIQAQGELLGFLSVEDNQPRIWEEVERQYICATAKLIGLVVANEKVEAMLDLALNDIHFAAEIAQTMVQCLAKEEALKNCSKLLCKRLNAEYVIILQPDKSGNFQPIFSTQPINRRPLTIALAPLEPKDRQWLGSKIESVMIEDLEENLRLSKWKESLMQLGMRSLLLCQMNQPNNSPDEFRDFPFLIIGHSTPRTWNRTERGLATTVTQQINLLLTLNQHSDAAKQSFIVYQTIQSGLSRLLIAPSNPVQFEKYWLEYLTNLLNCPLAAIISWTPQNPWATVTNSVAETSRFALSSDLMIPIANNAPIQEALATRHLVSTSVAELSPATRKSFTNSHISQLLIIPLYRGESPITDILLLCHRTEREFSPDIFPSLETLSQQFTWFRHYRYRIHQQGQEGKDLQTLNWYKHRCLEILHQSLRDSVNSLLDFDAMTNGKVERANSGDSEQITITELPKLPTTESKTTTLSPQPLQQMRHQQLLHQLEATLAMLAPILKNEEWQLASNLGAIPFASILKRVLHRVESLYEKRQIALKIHKPSKLSVFADRLKLECILFELFLIFCCQTPPKTQLHLWYSTLNPQSNSNDDTANLNPPPPQLEFLISPFDSLTDCQNAIASPARGIPSSSIQFPDSINLSICQDVLRSWGGDLEFYLLPMEQYLMRFLLRLAN